MSLETAMPEDADQIDELNVDTVETKKDFVPTPERVKQFLGNRTLDEVESLYRTVEGRESLYKELVEHEDYLKELHPNFRTDTLREQLDLIGDTLTEERRYLEDMSAPEKKGIFKRAWESVKGFASDHPVTTAVLLTALATASVAAGFYFTGNWELLMTTFGLDKVFGGAEAAGELIPVTPSTPPLPGGGVFEVPPPASPTGPIVPGIDTPL